MTTALFHRHQDRHSRTGRATAVLAALSLLTAGPMSTPARADAAQGPVVYVASLPDNEVFALDAGTGTTLATIPITAPQFLAVNPAGTELWISGQNGVSIVSTATDAVIAQLATGFGQITFNQTGTLAFVAAGDSADSVVDTATRTVVGLIAADYGAGQVVSSPDGSVVYTAQQRTDGIAVVDPATDNEITTISLNGSPGLGGGAAIAINPSGTRLYAAVPDQQVFYVIDTATDTIAVTIPIPGGISNMLLDPTGTHAYVMGSTITVIDTTTDTVTATLPRPDQAGPEISINPAGTVLYSTGFRSTAAYAIDTTTGAVLNTYPLASWASGLAVTLAAQPTTTALTIAPSGPVTAGSPVTLTASVIPAGTPGTTQFYDGAAALGAPVAVSAGTAAFTTSVLSTGTHTLTAVFTPTDTTSQASTSPPATEQINPAGITLDQSVTSTGTTTVTTAPITTSGPRLLLAYVAGDGPATKQTATVTGAGLTWTLIARADRVGTGTAEIWAATATTALTAATVTSVLKNPGYDELLTVIAYGGASGTGAIATAGKAKGAPTVTLTTTHANSWVFGVGEDYTAAIPRTLGPNQNLISQWVDTTPGETFWVQNQNAPTPMSNTPTTLNDIAPTGDIWNMAAVEILPTGP